VGSFLNVVIHRVPRGESVVRPPSSCPSCGQRIAWYHNVPLVSWVWLRGRCAACGDRISTRYPLVEALNAGAWLLVAWRFEAGVLGVVLMLYVSAMLALFFTDWDHQLLPDRITLPLFALGLLASPFNALLDLAPAALGSGSVWGRLGSSLAGALLGYGLFALLVLTWRVFFRREAMGGGDLKMMLGVGAFTGIAGVAVTVFLASLMGTLAALPFLLSGRWEMKRELPFGCFLAPAAAFAALWGRDLVVWYLRLL
jgi:leader peptidase (prepilin peptidase)/N-methyltransferase